jgi:hypothetical protein
VIDAGRQIGCILEIASILIQCGKKPGWNCPLLLSQQFRECGMEAPLNICRVQKEIAGVVAALGPLANIPSTLAQKALDVVRHAAPKGLEDVFKGPVANAGAFNNHDVECEDSKSELTCPGLLPIPEEQEGQEGSPKEGESGDKEGGEDQPKQEPGKEGKDTSSRERRTAKSVRRRVVKGRRSADRCRRPKKCIGHGL